MQANIEYQPELTFFEAASSNVFKNISMQRERGFHADRQSLRAVSKQSSFVSKTKLNPEAKPFVAKPIEWDRLPLGPRESCFSHTFDSDSYDASVISYSSSDDNYMIASNDGIYKIQQRLASALVPKKAHILPTMNDRYYHQPSYTDSLVFQDTLMDESRDIMVGNFSNIRRKDDPYYKKKCYHCGSLGHMAMECSRRKWGFDAVCFVCRQTGHKAAQCPTNGKTETSRMDTADSMYMQETDALMRNMCLNKSPVGLKHNTIVGPNWSGNTRLSRAKTLMNNRASRQSKSRSKVKSFSQNLENLKALRSLMNPCLSILRSN